MCPNCVTPWKCNGPHILEPRPYGIEDIIDDLIPLIRDTLVDGQRKRSPTYWKMDPGHRQSMYRHLIRDQAGELVDEDSGAHPLQHAGVRALMQAWQDTHDV